MKRYKRMGGVLLKNIGFYRNSILFLLLIKIPLMFIVNGGYLLKQYRNRISSPIQNANLKLLKFSGRSNDI